MEDIQSNLDSYHLQLQQVDAALTSDPTNEELLTLKADLEEVINLTKELLVNQGGGPVEPEVIQEGPSPSETEWKVGDKCLATWSEDAKSYEAIIEEIHPDGKVSVGFVGYSHGEVLDAAQLKPVNVKKSKSASAPREAASSSAGLKRPAPKETLAERKQALLKQKEYLKKRKQKKQARIEEQEQEREKEKKKWLNFSTKKGIVNKKKKSIFASPETVDGRVGIGTCGVSGKPMTEYSAAEKWRKGWK
jgi:survival-of-motor-neuron-related-splicing factor 30